MVQSKKDRLSSRTKSSKSDEVGDQEKERRAAWLAIRSAAAVTEAQRGRMLLTGDVSVTSQKLTDSAQENIPDFVALDLVSAYVLGEKKKVYKSRCYKAFIKWLFLIPDIGILNTCCLSKLEGEFNSVHQS